MFPTMKEALSRNFILADLDDAKTAFYYAVETVTWDLRESEIFCPSNQQKELYCLAELSGILPIRFNNKHWKKWMRPSFCNCRKARNRPWLKRRGDSLHLPPGKKTRVDTSCVDLDIASDPYILLAEPPKTLTERLAFRKFDCTGKAGKIAGVRGHLTSQRKNVKKDCLNCRDDKEDPSVLDRICCPCIERAGIG